MAEGKKTNIFSNITPGGLLSGIGSIYTGITAFKAANLQARDLRLEGEIAYGEAIRTASIIIEEGRNFAAGQSLQYLGSGVQIAGSALITLAQTKKYAETEATATRMRGEATKRKAETTARRTEMAGRASLVSGIIGGAASIFT